MRALALYLPQYHAFRENDEWWGKGYTEWTAVKNAVPLFEGHDEPREPYDGIYYDLSDESGERLALQARQAEEYGIYGFVFYHYYFTGHKLMERPMEILLRHPDIEMRYCICWANESWRRAWYDYNEEMLMEQTYGNESEWKAHFDYLLQFFADKRYIKKDGRPMLCIYRPFEIERLAGMRECFDRWAKEAGYDGIFLVGGRSGPGWDTRDICDACYYFEPGYSLKHGLTGAQTFRYNASVGARRVSNAVRQMLKKDIVLERRVPIDWIYEAVLKREYGMNEYPGIIARWDNTPRRGAKGLVYTGASPGKFKNALCKLKAKIPDDSFVFINAWNEWGEGAMLEPDKHEGYGYLEAVRDNVTMPLV